MILDLSEWSILRRWLRASETFRKTILPEVAPLENLRAILSGLNDHSEALKKIDRVLNPDGTLSESASSKLLQLSSEIRSLKREISHRMESLSRDYLQKGVLQGDYTDIRDGRYVLPVKISSQNEVEGLIYDSSASRQTVFIEPREVTEINNRLRQKQNEWAQEIHRILSELTQEFSPRTTVWKTDFSLLIEIDTVHARASVAQTYHGLELTCGSTEIDLPSTAHPLLWWSLSEEAIQKNSLRMDPHQRALLITGPNTGGKTVLLKTIGMAALFARTGFFFPTERPGRVPFFEEVFSDLGDIQSIEEHISSFSGHLIRFREILEKATSKSLVLLDELNSATDPEEGAALSRALLESLLDRGSWIVTTTHDPVLKSLGRLDSRILTAAMAFDEKLGNPTYRIELGIPGRSRALETAARLGIPPKVIDRAKSFLSIQHREWETWVKDLEKQVIEARLAAQQAQEIREQTEKKSEELNAKIHEFENELTNRTKQRIRQLLEQAQTQIQNKLQELHKAPTRKIVETSREAMIREAERQIDSAQEVFKSALHESGISYENRKQRPIEKTPATLQIKVGDRVRIPKWKSQGSVLEVRPEGQLRIAMGNLQITVKESEIEAISQKAERKSVKISWQSEPDLELSSTLDIRGLRLDEALSRCEKYLEAVFSTSRYLQVTIVHGLGTGALREGLRERLRELPFVSDFRDAGPGAGGTGATLIELAHP